MNADVLVRADREDVSHKIRENMDDPWETLCYWTVSGKPRRTGPGSMMLFSDGEDVWGTATITEIEDGKIWFKPIRLAKGLVYDVPVDPPTRGFRYITKEMVDE